MQREVSPCPIDEEVYENIMAVIAVMGWSWI